MLSFHDMVKPDAVRLGDNGRIKFIRIKLKCNVLCPFFIEGSLGLSPYHRQVFDRDIDKFCLMLTSHLPLPAIVFAAC